MASEVDQLPDHMQWRVGRKLKACASGITDDDSGHTHRIELHKGVLGHSLFFWLVPPLNPIPKCKKLDVPGSCKGFLRLSAPPPLINQCQHLSASFFNFVHDFFFLRAKLKAFKKAYKMPVAEGLQKNEKENFSK